MARRARMIRPGTPHHVAHRGNRREPNFLEPATKRFISACWSYGLMPNHVHVILTPTDETGLAQAVGAGPWLDQMERQLGRTLTPQSRGRKPRQAAEQPTESKLDLL